MAADISAKKNSNTQLLEELEALSQTLYQQHTVATTATTRRTASLALPRTSLPSIPSADDDSNTAKVDDFKPRNKPRARRMSLSPWWSRPKNDDSAIANAQPTQSGVRKLDENRETSSEKRGIWNWKPIRALSHITMQKISCLFSVEVVTAQGLPSSMNGLRLSVCVRKKETKDGAVQTMPSRVEQGAADFEETLFIRCHVYCTQGNAKQHLKFEQRPFWIYLSAVDAKQLDFGRNSVDLSELIQESIEKSHQGTRVRQWDTSFGLSGKAKGGELVLKLGFQIMEKDGGIEIYNQTEDSNSKSKSKLKNFSSSIARRQSKTSFSMPSPRLTSRNDAWIPTEAGETEGSIQGMDELDLDEPPNPVQGSAKKNAEAQPKVEDFDLPDFEVVDKGVEVQEDAAREESEKSMEVKSISSEVVKEIVQDKLQLNLSRLTELDSIAQQIKALESLMGEDNFKAMKTENETELQRLDADEETVTREFLQMLEEEEIKRFKFNQPEIPPLQLEDHHKDSSDPESKVYLSDLGKGLGCVIQTRDGGYLASMNPLDNAVARKDTPKLAMQMSKPFVLVSNSQQSLSGFELFQKLAGIGIEQLSSQVFSLMPVDELMGKTAEQVAFEGIAAAIIQGRNKEGASSSAARIVSALKSMANAMSLGRKERISTGLWNVDANPLTAENTLAFSMQKIESMAIEALKIQADMADEEAPFDVSALSGKTEEKGNDLLDSAISLEDWIKHQSYNNSEDSDDTEPAKITVAVVLQLRDPMRRYEAVGGPMMVLIHAKNAERKRNEYDERRFKVTNMHVGGFKLRGGTKKNAWDSENQRLTAMQWLVAYGLGKAGKKGKNVGKVQQDSLWSISSRIMADMWLKATRNPDVKLLK